MTLNIVIAQNHPVDDSLSLEITAELAINKGIIGVFGSSGCGKTSLLRCLAGLNDYQGEVRLDGRLISELSSHRNPMVYQPQQSQLFSHLNVEQNLTFVLDHKWQSEQLFSLKQVIDWCDLTSLLKRNIRGLSGGEAQRVSFARSLLSGKKIILLDEAFSALDWGRRQQMLTLLNHLNLHYELSFVLVSHSLQELATVSQHLLHMDAGKIIEQGDAVNLIQKLSQQQETCFSILTTEFKRHFPDLGLTELSLDGLVDTSIYIHKTPHSNNTRVQIPANRISLCRQDNHDSSIVNSLAAEIVAIENLPSSVLVTLVIGAQQLFAEISKWSCNKLALQPGQPIFAQFKAI